MAIKKQVICDVCGKECTRWFDISAYVSARDPWMNVSDLLTETGSLIWFKQMCPNCFKKIFQKY